jgi:cytochrome c biogenesis protein CcdA
MVDASCACDALSSCTHQAITQTCSIGKITSLAIVDAINPCAIAILTMILVALLIDNPKNKKKVLMGGLAFSAAIFIGYLFYGTILIQFFKTFTELIRGNASIIYNGLAIFAMILGALQIKDYFSYRPGGIATEMPMFMRPYAKLLTKKIHSTKGAFVIGFLVTIFLLPCTIGPYVIASGLLSEYSLVAAIPWLLYYNLIFILPMIFITLLIYFGFSKVEEVSGWKERNIKKLHLVAGILMFLVGISILFGWI